MGEIRHGDRIRVKKDAPSNAGLLAGAIGTYEEGDGEQRSYSRYVTLDEVLMVGGASVEGFSFANDCVLEDFIEKVDHDHCACETLIWGHKMGCPMAKETCRQPGE